MASVAAPAITHVWVARWETEDDAPEIRLFSTEDGCKRWRQEIATDNWNTGEDEPEDAEEAADRYFEYNECEYFNHYRETISN